MDALTNINETLTAFNTTTESVAATQQLLGEQQQHDLNQTSMCLVAMLNLIMLTRWVNAKYFGLPSSIMVSLAALLSSTIIYVMFTKQLSLYMITIMGDIHDKFSWLVLRWLLGFLLFADSTEMVADHIYYSGICIMVLAVLGTILSAITIGILTFALVNLVIPVSLLACLTFGALISPTDPVAVLSILKKHGDLLPQPMKSIIAGEALFNDVVGVVLFELCLSLMCQPTTSFSSQTAKLVMYQIAKTFVFQLGFGLLIGLSLGYGTYLFLSRNNHGSAIIDVGMTVILVVNINVLCDVMNGSLPLANIVAGLLLGNHGKRYAMSRRTLVCFHWIWKVLGDSLNTFLFMAIGFESFQWMLVWHLIGWKQLIFLPAMTITVCLVGRYSAIWICSAAFHLWEHDLDAIFQDWKKSVTLTWAGLRGAISIALVLALPNTYTEQDQLVLYMLTYSVVLFGIAVQGCSFATLVRCLDIQNEREDSFTVIDLEDTDEQNQSSCNFHDDQFSIVKPLPDLGTLLSSISESLSEKWSDRSWVGSAGESDGSGTISDDLGPSLSTLSSIKSGKFGNTSMNALLGWDAVLSNLEAQEERKRLDTLLDNRIASNKSATNVPKEPKGILSQRSFQGYDSIVCERKSGATVSYTGKVHFDTNKSRSVSPFDTTPRKAFVSSSTATSKAATAEPGTIISNEQPFLLANKPQLTRTSSFDEIKKYLSDVSEHEDCTIDDDNDYDQPDLCRDGDRYHRRISKHSSSSSNSSVVEPKLSLGKSKSMRAPRDDNMKTFVRSKSNRLYRISPAYNPPIELYGGKLEFLKISSNLPPLPPHTPPTAALNNESASSWNRGGSKNVDGSNEME